MEKFLDSFYVDNCATSADTKTKLELFISQSTYNRGQNWSMHVDNT